MGVMGREDSEFQKRHGDGGREDGRAMMGAKS